ncbi:MAG: hypothetical protein ACFFG0_03560 [Candidatus Thorarchaeota archaeon]
MNKFCLLLLIALFSFGCEKQEVKENVIIDKPTININIDKEDKIKNVKNAVSQYIKDTKGDFSYLGQIIYSDNEYDAWLTIIKDDFYDNHFKIDKNKEEEKQEEEIIKLIDTSSVISDNDAIIEFKATEIEGKDDADFWFEKYFEKVMENHDLRRELRQVKFNKRDYKK